MSIRVGCMSSCFHDLTPGVDPEPAIDIIGELGFDGIELVATAREDLKDFWTDQRIDRYKKKLDQKKLRVSVFGMFQRVVASLTSTRLDERHEALRAFEAGCRVAAKLGAPLVRTVSPWARELTGKEPYLPRYYEIDDPKPGEKFHIGIADGFDWDRVWAAYVETTKACLAVAKVHGVRFVIEQHTHCMVPDAASFLRLWDAVRDPGLGYNMDVGWTLVQREYPPLAIHKVRKQLMNLHMRDIDGHMRQFPHAGQGVMDFQAIIDTLKRIGFDGCVSLEQDKHPGDMTETCRRYLRMMKEYIG